MNIIHDGKQFLKGLGFDCEKPIKNADFTGVFLVGIVFDGIEFLNCDFSNSDLSYASFNNCSLYKCKFRNSMLYVTRIKSTVIIRADFSGSYLYGAQINDVEPTLALFDNLNFEPMFRQTQLESKTVQNVYELNSPCNVDALVGSSYSCNGEVVAYREFNTGEKWLRKAEAFNIIKRLLREAGYIDKSAEFYYFERQARRKAKTSLWHKIVELFLEVTCGYGERPWRSVICILLVWVVFAIVYPMLPAIDSNSTVTISQEVIDWSAKSDVKGLLATFYESLYFSAITMTTLGYGDGLPSGLAKIIAVFQTFAGMSFFALFVATLARKVIRD